MVEAGPLVADSGVCFIQCFDTDGWVAGISSVLKKTYSANPQRFSSGIAGRVHPKLKVASPSSFEIGCYVELVVIFVVLFFLYLLKDCYSIRSCKKK